MHFCELAFGCKICIEAIWYLIPLHRLPYPWDNALEIQRQVIFWQVSAHILSSLSLVVREQQCNTVTHCLTLLFICLIRYGFTIDCRCHCITALFSDKKRVSGLCVGAQLQSRWRQKIKISSAVVVIWFVD